MWPLYHEFRQQFSLVVSEQSSHHFSIRKYLNFMDLFRDWFRIHCLGCSYSSAFTVWAVSTLRHSRTELMSVPCQDSVQKFCPPLPSSADGTSKLSPFLELCERQSVVLISTTAASRKQITTQTSQSVEMMITRSMFTLSLLINNCTKWTAGRYIAR